MLLAQQRVDRRRAEQPAGLDEVDEHHEGQPARGEGGVGGGSKRLRGERGRGGEGEVRQQPGGGGGAWCGVVWCGVVWWWVVVVVVVRGGVYYGYRKSGLGP